jgi:hypothetical protein
VCGGTCWRGEDKQRRLRWGNMFDGLDIPIQTEQWNLLQLLEVGQGGGQGGDMVGVI